MGPVRCTAVLLLSVSCVALPLRAEAEPLHEVSLLVIDANSNARSDVDRASSYIATQFGIRTRVESWAGTNLTATALIRMGRARLEPGDIGVVIYKGGRSLDEDGMKKAAEESRAAIVMVDALMVTSTPERISATEQFSRRMEKEGMRWTGLLLGLPACPWPRCVMTAGGSEAAFDAKGRNLCPPCQQKARAAVMRRTKALARKDDR